MKTIFLDIDGVLNSATTPNPRNFPYIVDPRLLANLKSVVERTGANVVLSSTWRTDPIGLLAAKHFGVPFVDVSPDLPGVSRCEEMLKWLGDHPDVQRYAVIDDESDGLDDLPLFQPDGATGLTPEIADALVRFLNGETDETVRRSSIVRLGQNIKAMFKRDKS